jgi:hypothetical protein
MALGIAFSGSGNAEALSLLEPLVKCVPPLDLNPHTR